MALKRKAATLTLVLGMMAAASVGTPEASGTPDGIDRVTGSSGRIALVSSNTGGVLISLETRRPRTFPDDDTPLPPAA